MRSAQRRMDLQTARRAADAFLQRLHRGTGKLRVHAVRKTLSTQTAQEVIALNNVVNKLGYVFQLDVSMPQRIELIRVLELLAKHAEDKWQDLDVCPRTCPSNGASLVKYLRWFAPPNQVPPRTYLALHLGVMKSRTVLRFRLGAAKRPINAPSRDRQDRTCRCCQLGALGDERHLLLEGPAMRPVRQRFAHLFAKTDTMQMFIWQKDLLSVACYICAYTELHATLLEK